MKRNKLSASQTAKRLGVKAQTVYAYVSRGVLSRELAPDGRRSLFDAAEVDDLARRGRPRDNQQRVGTVEVSLGSAITEIQAARLCYRGHDASELARTSPFEAVAELLWSAELRSTVRWEALLRPPPLVRKVSALLPAESPAIERFSAVAASLACSHPLRVDLSLPSVVELARLLISSFVHALPPLQKQTPVRGFLAHVLWPRVSRLPATPARIALLNAALVLLADHELATSTLAARVSASTRADIFAVVLSGLGALSGPLHGKAAIALQRLLLEAAAETNTDLAVAHALGDATTPRGFGHPVYTAGDPRAIAILAALRPLTKARGLATIDAVSNAGQRRASAQPNVDFALAALAFAMDMPLGSTEALFAIARTAGFVAHALEEYGERPLRFRARAVYTG